MTQATVATPPVTEDVPVIKIGNATFRLIFHDLYRPLTEGEYAGLKDSIEKYGIQQDVTVVMHYPDDAPHNEKYYDVIDGANRLGIAENLGFSESMIPLNFADPNFNYDQKKALAESLNEDRRQLTVEERRERALKLRQQGQSYRQIGAALKVDPATAMRDVKASGVATPTPATVAGKDGKSYPAAIPEPPEQMIEFARSLIPAALLTWAKPVEAGHIARQVRKEAGAEHIAVKAVKIALGRMVEAGNVVMSKDATNHTVYALTHDPAIKPDERGGEAAAPEEQGDSVPPAALVDVRRAVLEALKDKPLRLIDFDDALPADLLVLALRELRESGAITRERVGGQEQFELVPDTAGQSDAWLDKQVSRPASAEQGATQQSKDGARILEHLPEGYGIPIFTLRAKCGLDKDRFHRALNLLEADGKVVRQVDAKYPSNNVVIRAELVKPAPAPEPPKTEEAPATSSADDQRLIVLLRTFITEADALRHALMSERAAGKKAALDSELYDGASEAHEIISGFTSLISKKYQSGLLDLLEDYLGWTKGHDAQEQES